MEQVQAIMQAADACDSPVIIQGSAGANRYAGEVFLRHLLLAAVEQYPSLKGFKWTDTSTWNNGNPLQVGVGFTEAPRGALGHWLSIFGGKIQNYQCIVASHWNARPRDGAGIPGPYEKSLEGHTLAIPTQPLEILRTIHSFDPCIGCAVHVTNPNGEELITVNVSTTLR
jgi:hydrogenase large subunit